MTNRAGFISGHRARRSMAAVFSLALGIGLAQVPAQRLAAAPAPQLPKKPPAEVPGRVKVCDVLQIQVSKDSTLPGEPIDGHYMVGPDGGVYLGPSYEVVPVAGLTLADAKKSVENHLALVLRNPKASVSQAGRVVDWKHPLDQDKLSRIEAGQKLHIAAKPTLPGEGIYGNRLYPVDKDGKVNLGKVTGKVAVAGLTPAQAAEAIRKRLAKLVKRPDRLNVLVWRSAPDWQKSCRVKAGQVLTILVPFDFLNPPIYGLFVVERDGRIVFPQEYGAVAVAGMTLDEATRTITNHLAKTIKDPSVIVFPGTWDRNYYKRRGNRGPKK